MYQNYRIKLKAQFSIVHKSAQISRKSNNKLEKEIFFGIFYRLTNIYLKIIFYYCTENNFCAQKGRNFYGIFTTKIIDLYSFLLI